MPNLILLSLLAAFPPLSTDMYLPAIPTLQSTWGISLAQANLSLVIFFIAFSVCLLIHGPLSDRFGRRPVLMGGIITFIVGSGLCAMADSITILILARVVQAAGAAGASALALALTKDLYDGVQRQKMLGYIGVIMAFCPMLAPTLGGLLLKVGSWRMIFVLQGVLALAALYGTIRLKEPLEEFTSGGLLSVAGRYLTVLKNRNYIIYAMAFAVVILPHFAFIGGSPAIYITGLGLSEQAYGIYFGLNALGFMLGSLTCTRLSGVYKPVHMLIAALVTMLLAGSALIYLGGETPLSVMIPMFCITYAVGVSRPISNNLILDQVETDIGAASALMTFLIFMVGAFAMEIIALDLGAKVNVLGVLAFIGAIIPLVSLLGVRKKA